MPLEPCMECGETAVAERIVPFVVERGEKTATIMDRLMVCGSCGFDVYRGNQATEHERAVADAVRKLDGLLSPDDLRAFRERSGRGPEGMDEMLSLRPGTWARWERGRVPHDPATDAFIRGQAA